jgi:hypothetical protein
MTITAPARRETLVQPRRDPGSFRDPDGGVIHLGDRILRYYRTDAAPAFQALNDSGLLRDLESRDLLVGSTPVDAGDEPEVYEGVRRAVGEDVGVVVEHPRVPFVSYAYEWPLEMLRDAAVCQLDVAEAALYRGYTVKDATSYNLQFRGPAPVFIDVASFEPHAEGTAWAGYAQFCRMFLNPLLLQSLRGVPFHPWLRHSLAGIDPSDLTRLLSFSNKMRPSVFIHVVLQSFLNRKMAGSASVQKAGSQKISKDATLGLVRGLRGAVSKLKRRGNDRSTWIDYEENLPYAAEARAEKERFVEEAVASVSPRVTWDLGCNRGLYTLIAARHSGQVVAFDFDEPTVGALYETVRGKQSNVLPLVADLMNPSPDQGWAQSERMGLAARGPADFALALALVHHLAIGGNVPLPNVVGWFADVSRAGVIEFVPKSDPMVQRLLSTRPDVFPDYTEAAFERALEDRFTIGERYSLPGSERVLYLISRK